MSWGQEVAWLGKGGGDQSFICIESERGRTIAKRWVEETQGRSEKLLTGEGKELLQRRHSRGHVQNKRAKEFGHKGEKCRRRKEAASFGGWWDGSWVWAEAAGMPKAASALSQNPSLLPFQNCDAGLGFNCAQGSQWWALLGMFSRSPRLLLATSTTARQPANWGFILCIG